MRAVKRVLASSKARAVFIQESKLRESKPRLINKIWGSRSANLVFVPSEGAAGGLISISISIWDPNFFLIESQTCGSRFIMLIGRIGKCKIRCGLVNVYAPNDMRERRMFFEHLTNVIEISDVPVIIGGDFNTVKSSEEKLGGEANFQATNDFLEFIQKNNLVDLPLAGSKYTWFRGGSNVSANRLDRFLISPEIFASHPSFIQVAMPRSLSDHNPILLSEESSVRLPWPFKFFSHWADRLELVEVVKNLTSMNLGEGAGNLLRAIKVAVKSWVKEFKKADGESVMNIENKISKLEGEAVKTRNNDIVRKDIQALRSDLWAKYRREEKEWLQKSRLKWFKDGDKNTSFLHTFASVRNKANHISVIKMDQNTTSDQKSISEAFVKHFREFYNETPTIELKRFEVEFMKLSKSSILLLEAPFTEEEVWSAINSADGSRAPGPDRFNLDFYKRFWASIKSEVTAFFGNFFEGKVSDKSINHSFSPNPKAGKQITDCALIANEMIDYLRRNNFAAVMVKADFKKAYDTIDWNFLNLILQKMVFDNRWREWVRFCISSASISVLINGSPSSMFSIKRGLRQGCPLSPFLFNLVGEALSGLFRKALANGLMKGVPIRSGGLTLSHLQFADDLVLFSAANEDYVKNIKRVLRIFEVASDLKLNMKKTDFWHQRRQ
ncbi:hypothetical protein GQ457_03G033020 [Hibiscus cannabinus]